MSSGPIKRSAPVLCPLCNAPMQQISNRIREGAEGSAWRCSRSPACGGLLLEDRVESQASGADAGAGAGEPFRPHRVPPAGNRESTRPSRGGAEPEAPAPGSGSVRVERIRLRPRVSPPGRASRPSPSRGPRSGLSTARIGVLLLCLAGAGVAVLLWASQAPAHRWVEVSFSELATGFRNAFTGSSPATVPHRVRAQAARLCDWSRARFPRIAPGKSSTRLFFLHTGEGPAYFDCGRGSWETVGFLSPVYLRTCAAGRDPCDSGVAGFATPLLLDGQTRGNCDAVVILPSGAAARASSDKDLRRTVVHEYVIHCGLAKLLTNEEKERFLERVAEHVPHSRLRGWFEDPHQEAYYRHRHGVGPDLVTPAGYVDVSSTNPFVTDRERALGYVEEAFAAFVDGDLASEVPRQRSPRAEFEIRVHMVADMLLAVAEGKEEIPTLVAVVESL